MARQEFKTGVAAYVVSHRIVERLPICRPVWFTVRWRETALGDGQCTVVMPWFRLEDAQSAADKWWNDTVALVMHPHGGMTCFCHGRDQEPPGPVFATAARQAVLASSWAVPGADGTEGWV